MITKRQLGILLVAGGLLTLLGLFVVNRVGATSFAGVGPLERALLIGAGSVALLGLPLLWLGDRPA